MSETPTFNIDDVPEHLKARVLSLIPSQQWADGYVSRDVLGHQDLDLFDGAKKIQQNIIMEGPTGSAKSMVAKAYAAKHGVPFARVNFNGAMDPAAVLGFVHIGADGEVEQVDGDATLVVRFGGVLFLDEANMTHAKLGAAFHQILDDDRRLTLVDFGETVNAHPDLLILGAYNKGYTGTARLNEAFIDRFHIPLDWDYDESVEQTLVGDFSERLLDVARNIRRLDEVRTPVSTRTLVAFIEQVDAFGYDTAAALFTNRFDPIERPSVSRVMEAQGAAIALELGVTDEDDVS